MFMRLKPTMHWTTQVLCCLLLAVLLAACGAAGTSGSSTPSAPTPTPKSTSTAMTNLVGNGFTMSYPQSWQVKRSGTHLVTLVDSTGAMKFDISVIPDPNAAVSADSLASTGAKVASVALKNAQTVTVAPTATIGGESWTQKSVSGVQRLNNAETEIQVTVVASVYPAKAPTSKGYTIDYRAPKSMFDSANTTYFQPMLQTFKFV